MNIKRNTILILAIAIGGFLAGCTGQEITNPVPTPSAPAAETTTSTTSEPSIVGELPPGSQASGAIAMGDEGDAGVTSTSPATSDNSILTVNATFASTDGYKMKVSVTYDAPFNPKTEGSEGVQSQYLSLYRDQCSDTGGGWLLDQGGQLMGALVTATDVSGSGFAWPHLAIGVEGLGGSWNAASNVPMFPHAGSSPCVDNGAIVGPGTGQVVFTSNNVYTPNNPTGAGWKTNFLGVNFNPGFGSLTSCSVQQGAAVAGMTLVDNPSGNQCGIVGATN